MGRALFCFLLPLFCICLESQAQLVFQPNRVKYLKPGTEALLPQNFYIHTLPFTCKKESQLQKLTGLNLFLRLGSKAYVDYLENKAFTGRKF